MSLTRRTLVKGGLAGTGAFALSASWLAPLAAGQAAGLYQNAMVIDGLGFPGRMGGPGESELDAAEIEDLRASGLTAVHLTVGVVGSMPSSEAFEKVVRNIAEWDGRIDRHADVLARVHSAADLDAARSAGKTGLIYGLQDGVSFEDDIGRLDALAQFGIRVVQPTYNRRNLLGDGCMEPADAGLSRDGIAAVERIHELELLLDLSHCGRRTAGDALAHSKRPVSFTHTGCHALVEHPRHRTDEEMRAVADGGGVIGIYIMPYLARGRQPVAADVIAHLEHALDVAGEDHVSLGTDGMVSATEVTAAFKDQFRRITRDRKERGIAAPFETEEGYLFASDLNVPNRYEVLADLLLARGHSEQRVEKILGSNLRRLFGEVWPD